ncbi:hypothetical protein [Mucilaginibacter pedocola]|uniref:Uncharacterized protein n=1 Tax=Mucilaginibacter pedocola TaxID=1792845 RepID=A0A1S9P9G0_9SPHI|nr:hypothetical protein [Mucilaginibacter pedocola]OOQ57616.1 hypothetical protein BC343_12480 [Mucilaginibacter pedocola]
MIGTLAQLIAIISYGNAFLMDQNWKKLDFENSTLKYCNRVTFVNDKSSENHGVVAEDIQEWFVFLKKSGCQRLKLFYKPKNRDNVGRERLDAGFVEGSDVWMVEVVFANHSDYWMVNEQVTNEQAKDRRIWGVKYFLASSGHSSASPTLASLNKAKAELDSSLKEIISFSDKHKLKYWAETFSKAKQNLESSHPAIGYYKDFIIEENMALLSRQVLFSAGEAWVFGGMGTWNDLLFNNSKDNNMYNRLSDSLYKSVVKAIIAGVNI